MTTVAAPDPDWAAGQITPGGIPVADVELGHDCITETLVKAGFTKEEILRFGPGKREALRPGDEPRFTKFFETLQQAAKTCPAGS